MTTKTTLALLAAMLLAGASHAQTTTPFGTDPTAKAMTREMSNRLLLNEGQYIKLYSINHTRLNRQQEIERATTDTAARTAQLTELQTQYEQECARILTPSQLAQLQQEPAQAVVGSGRG